MSTNPTPAEVTRETYRETPDEFFARMKKRGEFTVAHQAVQAREQRNKKDSNIKKADALHKAFEYTSTVTFPFTDAEWAEIQQRVDADTKAPAERVDEKPKPAEATNAPREEDPTTAAEMDALVARCDGDPVDLERDLTWAYQNLGKRIEEKNQRGDRDDGSSLETLYRRFEKEVLGMK